MATVFDVSDWFLSKESMSPKKVQKLCYYYKAWGLALYETDLLPNSVFEAWVHGPVCDELYQEYKGYGWNDIPQTEDNSDKFNEKELDILESVWLTYGDMSANALEVQTHLEEPWRKARKGVPEGVICTEPISNKDMEVFYRKLYDENQGD